MLTQPLQFTTLCRQHRQQHGLSPDFAPNTLDCQHTCLAWTTCPWMRCPCLQPRPVIDRFFGAYIWLSNFYYVPGGLSYAGHSYATVEHAFQAAKTPDPAWRARIRRCATPKAAKRLGRRCPLRPDWDTLKVTVMTDLVQRKFDPAHHPDLTRKLLATGEALLIEGNTWGERFWGVERRTGLGLNHLGRILMATRDRYRRLE